MTIPPVPQLVRSLIWLALVGLVVLVADAALDQIKRR